MIQAGTLVENPLKPEWGPGKVLRVEGAIAVVLFRNAPDGEAKRFKADFLTVASRQTDPELDAIQLPRAGAAGRTRAARARKGEAGDERSKLAWLGSEGDEMYSAFRLVFDPQAEAFGGPPLGHGGLTDGNQGVQWNATFFPTLGERRVGVNLEGIRYDGWPIWRLISRELREPTFPELVADLDAASRIIVRWERDCWQASSRRAILEQEIEPSPMPASELTPEAWRKMLRQAADCLAPANGTLKRAKRSVTLAANHQQRVADVSPHLMIHVQADGPVAWLQLMQEARTELQPIYDWVVERSRPRG